MTLKNTLGLFFATALIVTATACGGSGESAPAEIHVGTPCDKLSAAEGLYHCDGQQVLFCSSHTEYKFKEMTVCGEGKTCEIAPDKKSSSCK